jgi:hypothetical protein
MKGYRTPSWFRSKVSLRRKQIKARRAEPRTRKLGNGKINRNLYMHRPNGKEYVRMEVIC